MRLGPPGNSGSSPHLKSLTLITAAKSLLPHKVTNSQVPRIRTFGEGGGIIPPTTYGKEGKQVHQ